jgi:predicted membrane metal-binding protein
MSIIIIPTEIVKSLLRSKFFWLSIGALAFLLWLAKFDLKKTWKILKLLGEMVAKIFALFLGLTLKPLVEVFQKDEESRG